ncbi:MAG: Flp pilus assembly protein CpaB [Veillonellaceae bacterium]|nr:Flp pilus assembly protein CpaB [Veillonellaceae bacterium]
MKLGLGFLKKKKSNGGVASPNKKKIFGGISESIGKLSPKQLGFLAVAAGVAAAFLVGIALANVSGTRASSDQMKPTVQVVVAKEDIPARAVIRESMLKMESVPADRIPDGAVSDIADAVGKPATVPIMQGDVVTTKKILSDPQAAGFTGMIPANCRAISIPVTDITGISGFAKPGDYVDVMLIRKGDKNSGRVDGEIIMQNVLLLAINKNASAETPNEGNGDKKKKAKEDASSKAAAQPMATATLALRPDDALRLAVAAQSGTIYLVLRPYHPQDSVVLDTEFSIDGANDEAPPQTTAPQTPAPQPAAAPSPTPSPSYAQPSRQQYDPTPAAPSVPVYDSVEVIRGTTSSTIDLK